MTHGHCGEEPSDIAEYSVGPLAFLTAGGVFRRVSWNGVEVIRAVDCPVRDEDWGTFSPQDVTRKCETGAHLIRIERRFGIADHALQCTEIAEFSASGLVEFDLLLAANTEFSTNRAGFTLLHPIAGLAGSPFSVVHPDGSVLKAEFAEQISPGQPARNIAALSYELGGVEVQLSFEGEIFEMEDQRNWSDASFKTYCRPLELPFPYIIAPGKTVRQKIRMRFTSKDGGLRRSRAAEKITIGARLGRFPSSLAAVEPEWLDNETDAHAGMTANGLLVRVTAGTDQLAEQMDGVSRLARRSGLPVDAEIVLTEGINCQQQLDEMRDTLAQAQIMPERVIALPAAYLKSYQPEGSWPDGPTPADSAKAARSSFPDALIGGGMLTHFTEFNRHPPKPNLVDYVTHGNCAIVHAADDMSVFQTLETLPQVFSSAHALAGERPYRLGLVAIGMRSNPYGADVAPNPNRERIAMARSDPRQNSCFAAAYAVGAYACAAATGCDAITLHSIGGPFATASKTRLYPLFHVARRLREFSLLHRRKLAGLPDGVFGMAAERRDGRTSVVLANCSLTPVSVAFAQPVSCRVLDSSTHPSFATDRDWLANASECRAEKFEAEPCSVLFLELGAEHGE